MKGYNLDDMVYSVVTVGERGQIVIPADARKNCNIAPGDKLMVFKDPMHQKWMIFAKISDLHEIHQAMIKRLDELKNKIEELDKIEHNGEGE